MSDNLGQEGQRKFECFFALPPEIRMMMIDKMGLENICQFRRSSKQCNKEATSSKKFRNSINFRAVANTHIMLFVQYGNFEENYHGFEWYFGTDNDTGKKHMRYKSLKTNREVWRVEFDDSTNLPLLALSIFKKILKSHQMRMEELSINGDLFQTDFKNVDLELENLNCLKRLSLSDIEISQFLPKIRRPLKELHIGKETNCEILSSFELLYQVQDNLYVPTLELNKEQFLNLSASKIDIDIGQLTIDDIYNFVKDWQNGFIRENFKRCCWYFDYDMEERNKYRTDFFARFGVKFRDSGLGTIKRIKQKGNCSKSAVLSRSAGLQISVYEK